MSIQFHQISYAEHLKPPDRGDRQLHLVYAKGRAAQLQVPDGWRSLWMPLSGAMEVMSRDLQWKLSPRDCLFWHEGGVQNCGRGGSWFLALCGPSMAWQRHMPTPHGSENDGKCTFPSHAGCPRDVRRLLVRLARVTMRSEASRETEHVVSALLGALSDSQGPIRMSLQQCTGRTEKQRQQNLLRLLQVRHRIEYSRDTSFDLLQLSRAANYSPWHLTRTYREVFGESPSEHATRLRFARAMELVRESTLTIAEITEALGYESQSTFCRSFKKMYGATTTQTRTARATGSH
ncbi:MAG: helix-turn-helix transcriptional regulator [Pseudoxanthomonas sp.]